MVIFDLLGAIERPKNEPWYQISNNFHHFISKKALKYVYGRAEVMFSPDFVLILQENRVLLSLCGAMFDLLGAIERSTNEPWCHISNSSHYLMCKRLKNESVEPLGLGFGQFCMFS